MIKTTITTAFLLLVSFSMYTQSNTEVYIFDIGENLELSNPVNISNNPGAYDNQPSFIDDNALLFSSTHDGQTDIKEVSFKTGTNRWVSYTLGGSEYSPLKIPETNAVSSIRLDKDGKQLLYAYSLENGQDKVLVEDLVIGYHTWYSKEHIVSFVLGEQSSLVVSDLKAKTNRTLQKNIGRSLHKIPNTDLVSYISKEKDQWEIRSIHPLTGETAFIINTPKAAEDMCWTPGGTILIGKDDQLFKYHPGKDEGWVKLENLSKYKMNGITRIAMSPNGKKLAVVVAEKENPFENSTIQMGVVVSDLQESLDFYKKIIGMEEVGEFSVPKEFGKDSGLTGGLPFDVKILKLEDHPGANQYKLMSFKKPKKKKTGHIQDDTGVQYITIFVKSVKPFIERCKRNNIPLLGKTPIKLADGRSFVLIQDPDGTFIELIGGE